MDTPKTLVNPVSLKNCEVRYGELVSPVLDLSFVRLVVADPDSWSELEGHAPVQVELRLGDRSLSVMVSPQKRGEHWIRLSIEHIVPSHKAALASFLSPRKIGESIQLDWQSDEFRHFHGLNESELWFDSRGGLLFSYLFPSEIENQFIVRIKEKDAPLRVGRLSRKEYFEIKSWEEELPLIPLRENEVYDRLGECRDIITNIRPVGEMEYSLKQRLLRVMSESLYSTGRKFERISPTPIL